MSELPWIAEGRRLIGLQESLNGNPSNPEVLQMWRDIKRGGIKSDKIPWCAAFVGSMLERSGIKSTRFESAKSYLNWGEVIEKPCYGCVAVFTRDGGGHVGFVVGITRMGNLLILGGNQSDAVNIKSFARNRVSGYRWPVGVENQNIKLEYGEAQLSQNEQ